MIEEVKAYKVGDKTFGNIKEAQQELLFQLFTNAAWPDEAAPEPYAAVAASFSLNRSDELVAILTNKPLPKPRKPRKDKGTKRNRTASNDDIGSGNETKG